MDIPKSGFFGMDIWKSGFPGWIPGARKWISGDGFLDFNPP
jgi:hypothetical protein